MKNTLKRTLGLGLTMTILLAGTIAGSLYYYIAARAAETNLNNYRNTMINNFAENLAMYLWNFDDRAIELACTALLESRDRVGVRVFDEKNHVVFERGEFTVSGPGHVVKEVYHDGKVIGRFEIAFSKHLLWESKKNIIFAAFIVVLAIVLSFLPFTQLIVTRVIINPIAKLTKGAEIIGKGNLEHKIDVKAKNEIGELAMAFNKMAADLKISRGKIEEYSKGLEMKVAERTKDLEKAYLSLKKRGEELQGAKAGLEEKSKLLEAAKAELEEKVLERTKELEEEVNELERFNKLVVDRELKMAELKERIKGLEGKG